MATSTFNLETIAKLKKGKEALETIAPSMQKGVENSVAIAEESGAANYIANAKAMEEATPALIKKTVPELIECLGRLINHYENLAGNL